MAVKNAMFLFEVVVENVKSMVESRILVIKSDFANIFSLELKDPKQMHIVMPEPLPLPPEPPGKKGKKKKKKKPKPKKAKKGKKGKKGKVEEPPPEPAIQSGQSVLFSSSAQILIQNMKKCPLELSLWSKEENLVFIGTTCIPWDPIFILYLEKIINCQEPPPVVVKDEYNIFEEGRAKLMAKISIQIKLSHLNDKVTTAFRTLSEDATIRKCLYTGINSKTTSYMCTLKTTDEIFEENCNKIENQFIKSKPTKITFADYKNAPGANLTYFNEDDNYCCRSHADKPPESKYKAPETCPDIDFIIDYVRKIIVSCNDNMRMLTPRPTISPRVKATDIDRLCYCRETAWPKGAFAERFKREAKIGPCPLCIDAGKKPTQSNATTFDIANIRGPCGKPECKIARDIRAYIEDLIDEDNVEFCLDDLIGPCGSKDCTLVGKIHDFLRHEGVFTHGATLEGMSTQCACVEKMQEALTTRDSCASICSKDCEEVSSEESICGGKGCPYRKPEQNIYDVFYFTVEYDFEHKSDKNPDDKSPDGNESDAKSSKSSKYKYCGPECPSAKDSDTKTSCSKTVCSTDTDKMNDADDRGAHSKCFAPVCPRFQDFPPSPADSNVEITFDEIRNPCCVKSCDIAERVKEFIAEGAPKKKKCKQGEEHEDACFCDCECTFKFSNKTTYCAVCGGYECLGDDMRDQPEFIKPHPCPVYHKLYDRKYINVQSPWPEEEQKKDTASSKGSKAGSKTGEKSGDKKSAAKVAKIVIDKKSVPEKKVPETKEGGEEKLKKSRKEGSDEKLKKTKKTKKEESGDEKVKKLGGKKGRKPIPTADAAQVVAKKEKKEKSKHSHHYPPVPGTMGWNWVADDVPGMKVRPNWRPGAANAVLVRRYRAQREGQDSMNKKKRALMQRKKKIEMKPTLIVTKQDGEYTVQMEVFKKFSKERLLFQYPYDEKPPLIYTIGKTAEEKRKIQRQRDRKERRETRRKSRLLQSTFRDRCQEICLKAYNQAIGLLPLPNPNAPDCACTAKPDLSASPPIIDSCSCSDLGTISTSDTDNDEWVIEFTPPAARWDAKAKHPPSTTEDETQYNYLDYKVKLLDKTGNPVPRFFKGPDGKQECSDLGGFWGPKKCWLEINKDGYIGPDSRWVPMSFKGPDGFFYTSEEGCFTDNTGTWKIGIDGYIDKDGNWVWYSKKKGPKSTKSKSTATASTVDAKKGAKSPANASSKGKAGDNKNKKEGATKSKKEEGKLSPEKKKSPAFTYPVKKGTKNSVKTKNPIVMTVSVNYDRNKLPRVSQVERKQYHMDQKKLAKYRQIIEELRVYDDIGELKLPVKTNRASNTPRKQLSPLMMPGFMNYEKKMYSSLGLRTSTTASPVGSPMTKSNLLEL